MGGYTRTPARETINTRGTGALKTENTFGERTNGEIRNGIFIGFDVDQSSRAYYPSLFRTAQWRASKLSEPTAAVE